MSLTTRSLGSGYTTAAKVRTLSGIPVADVSDTDMNTLIVQASDQFHHDITVRGWYCNAYPLNAGRTRFSLPYPFIADRNLDSVVNATDITVEFVKRDDSTGQVLTSATGVVTIEDAARAVFSTANALPADYECVVTYDRYLRPLDLKTADEAVAFLAAHFATLRLKRVGNISTADLTGAQQKDHGNRVTALNSHRTKYLKQYEIALARIRGSGGVLA